ncbi:hypothetical protein [Marmoricola sp. URHB0036]|uniref:hypothetical protein n=1 Tax=Marmoricola sp. URHB0036 TaxID=1298863 RepID=UPI0012DF50B5|nr:hypothetical protein [Marmoricola sp. URHB0036]
MNAPQSTVLRLTLSPRAGKEVAVLASMPTDADATDDRVLSLAPHDFGLPVSLSRSHIDEGHFHIPTLLEDMVRSALEKTEPNVLWLQLAEPFGYLALVPWERLLQALFDVTVVRLPTLTLSRRTPHDSLQVAILVAVPDRERPGPLRTTLHGTAVAATNSIPGSGARARAADSDVEGKSRGRRNRRAIESRALEVDRVVRAVLHGSTRRTTTVHVIPTLWTYHELRKMWHGLKRTNVVLHDPRVLQKQVRAEQSDTGETRRIPWLRLLKAAQGGEQADVVHLICGAQVTDSKARLVLADPMKRTPDVSSRFVSISSLIATLDELGAWSLCLSSPAGSKSSAQMRYLGCRIAEMRPGPVLVTDLSADPGCGEVEAGYQFLYAQEQGTPPRLTHGMLVSEPTRAPDDLLPLTYGVASSADARPRGAAATLMEAENTPIWLAAAQRFVEQRQVQLAQYQKTAKSGTQTPEAAAVALGVEVALAAIQEALATKASALIERKQHG